MIEVNPDYNLRLSMEEAEFLLEDQRASIESVHPALGECENASAERQFEDCPPEHFGEGELEMVQMRQGIAQKLRFIVEVWKGA